MAFPPGLNPNGTLRVSKNEESIRQAIRIILSTPLGQRPMRPEFGCGVHKYVFEELNAANLARIREEVREALVRWEPRIVLEKIDVRPEDGQALVEITYRIRATNHRQNLVWPFYLKEGG